MAFPEAFLDELIARNPIEDVVSQYVNLKRSGSNLFGLCPFHGEKTPSFSVSPDKGIYYCFGCHKGGSVINFEMPSGRWPNGQAWRFLRTSSTSPGTASRSGSGLSTRRRPGSFTAGFMPPLGQTPSNTPQVGECPNPF